jgi:hypothetical protein
MTTIHLAYDIPAVTVGKIQGMLDDVALRDPAWNGAKFQIERDEYTYIDSSSLDAVSLYCSIIDVINGEDE